MSLGDEPTFTLRGQDITAALTVSFWTEAQLWIRARIGDGWTQDEAVDGLRIRMRELFMSHKYHTLDAADPLMQKLGSATEVAAQMQLWPIKKLAD